MRKIKLTQGKYAIVDDKDYFNLNKYNWHYAIYGKEKGYAKRNNPNKTPALLRMHRVIINAKKGQEVDHINGNTLDNRKNNLRIVTRSQNMMNTGLRITNKSGFKGVSWDKRWNNWVANVWKDGKEIYVGCFKNKKEAAKAYNNAAIKHHGEFARLNTV